MKLRTGFVSNSSSSSFIVAVKRNGKATGKITITKEIDLNQYASRTIETAEEIYDYFRNEYGEKSEWGSWVTKNYKLALKEIANGKIILAGSFSDQDDYEERMLCEEGLQSLNSENITVIHSEAGY